MKLPKEIINAIIIFAGISLYFLAIDLLGFTNNHWLRLFNFFFVFLGVNLSLNSNIAEGKKGYGVNILSAITTAFLGVVLSVISLVAFVNIKGGDGFIHKLPADLLFGGKPTANEFCLGVLFEGIASALIVVFLSIQYWRSKMAAQD